MVYEIKRREREEYKVRTVTGLVLFSWKLVGIKSDHLMKIKIHRFSLLEMLLLDKATFWRVHFFCIYFYKNVQELSDIFV